MCLLLASKVGGNLTPLRRVPFQHRRGTGMGQQPVLGAGDDLMELGRPGVAHQRSLALALLDPQRRIVGVGVDDLPLDASLLHERQGVDNSEKLSDIVCPVDRAIVEHLLARLQVDAPILHRAWIARTGRIDRPGIGIDLWGQRQDGIVAPGGGILRDVFVHISGEKAKGPRTCFSQERKTRTGGSRRASPPAASRLCPCPLREYSTFSRAPRYPADPCRS